MSTPGRSSWRGPAVAALVVVGLAGCSLSGTTDEPPTTPPPPISDEAGAGGTSVPVAGEGQGRAAVVTKITDGDTIWVIPPGADAEDRGAREKVRLIGMDTPEVHGQQECFGSEASAALERLIPVGTAVRLVRQVSDTDRYGRTLADVYRAGDGLFVNLELVEQGFAVPLSVPPDVAHADAMVAASRRAREAGRGLWSAC